MTAADLFSFNAILESKQHGATSDCWRLLQDETVLKDLAARDVALNFRGILQRVHDYCFELDMTPLITSSEALLSIHSSAEDFAPTAEKAYVPFQVLVLYGML